MNNFIKIGSTLFFNTKCKDIDFVYYNFDTTKQVDIITWNLDKDKFFNTILTYKNFQHIDCLYNYQLDSFYQKEDVFGFKYDILNYRENAIKFLKFNAKHSYVFDFNNFNCYKSSYHYYINYIIFKYNRHELFENEILIAKKYHDCNYTKNDISQLYNDIINLI